MKRRDFIKKTGAITGGVALSGVPMINVFGQSSTPTKGGVLRWGHSETSQNIDMHQTGTASTHRTMNNIMESNLESVQADIEIINGDLTRLLPDIEIFRRSIDDMNREGDTFFQHMINMLSVRVDSADKQLSTLDPTATLRRGFTVVQDDRGSVVSSSKSVRGGKIYSLVFADGISRVQSADKKP